MSKDLFKHLRSVDENGKVTFLPNKKVVVKQRLNNVLATWVDKNSGKDSVIASSLAILPEVLKGYPLRKCGRNSEYGSENQYPEILSTEIFDTPEGKMSELEWFSKKMGQDLDPKRVQKNWWEGWAATNSDSSHKSEEVVYLTNEPKTFDLSNIIDNLHYRILYISHDEIAKTFEQRNDLQTYKFYLEDEDAQADVKMETMDLQLQAFGKLNEILTAQDKKDKLLEILITQDPNTRLTYSTELSQLEKMVKTLCMDTPKQFVALCNENNKDKRLAIHFAAKNGEDIKKRGERYETSGGEIIGTIYEVIEKMQKDTDFATRIEYQLQKAKGVANTPINKSKKKE